MQLMIDIPEETFKYYVTLANKGEQIGNLERIILDGTPLPKGHGRLIDADYMIKQLLSLPKDELSTDDTWAMKVLGLAPTIIEGSDS